MQEENNYGWKIKQATWKYSYSAIFINFYGKKKWFFPFCYELLRKGWYGEINPYLKPGTIA